MDRFLKLVMVVGLWTVGIFGACAESVVLFNDNGEGGIRRTTAKVVVEDGQYYVDFPVAGPNGRRKTERLKVYRVRDSASLMYHQAKWAEKYEYAVERRQGYSSTVPYYFNMKSTWKPSLTHDPGDPSHVEPIMKLTAYRDDFSGGKTAMKVVLIKTQGKHMLYYGDDFFGAVIESNKVPKRCSPAWSRKYKYRAEISGFDVYFNIINLPSKTGARK